MAPNESSEPVLFIIFGATGDLLKRKLLPAFLREIADSETDPENIALLGVARDTEYDDASYRNWISEQVKDDEKCTGVFRQGKFLDRVFYHTLPETDEEQFGKLNNKIKKVEKSLGLKGNRAFYLAIPPQGFVPTITHLGKAGLNTSGGWTRLVIEKPFGRDLESARSLNDSLHEYFDESQIYRIDHYLGKETVQNLLVFRFANAIFESQWNRNHIDSIQITVAEDIGIGHRAGYYDQAGAIRDMVQNHMTQLVSLIGMEIPSAMRSDAIRAEKVKVLESIRDIRPENVVLGQYVSGEVRRQTVPGYTEEDGIDDQSGTETFAAMKLEINNWRWQGVPFYIRTGKRLAERVTQVVIRFRQPPVSLFHPTDQCTMDSNNLILTIQPDEGADLQFHVKTPGDGLDTEIHELGFRYSDVFKPLQPAYQTLLLDIIQGDQTLFVHADETEASWRLYTPIISGNQPVYPYPAGTWGPSEAINLPERYQQRWITF